MEENPGPGLDKTLLGVLAPGSHHVLAERFDMTKIGAGPKVRRLCFQRCVLLWRT